MAYINLYLYSRDGNTCDAEMCSGYMRVFYLNDAVKETVNLGFPASS
jgi:hypothetical protein